MSTPEKLQIERIQKTVADFYGMRVSQMKERSRYQLACTHRQVAMYLSRTMTGSAFQLIGDCFSRDNTTIQHAVKTIHAKAGQDQKLAGEILSLSRSLKPLLAPFPVTK